MKAVILVGGFGTRLRPLTLSAPKQMLPMGHVTMLERVVTELGGLGVEEVVLSLGYQPDPFLAQFPDDRCAGVHIHYAVEPEPLDTAGAIRFAALEAGIDSRFLALNGDVLTDLDVADLWARHDAFGGLGTIALTKVDDPSRYGVVVLDNTNRVEAFVEKPDPGTAPSNWINAGTYVLEADVLDLIPDGLRVSIERVTFPELVAQGSLYALPCDAYWIDAGTPEAYLQAHLDLLDGVRGDREIGPHPDARIDGTATVVRSTVGSGAVIAGGAVVTDSVVMADAYVGPGAVLDRCLVGIGARIGEGAKLSDLTVVGFGEDVPAGTVSECGRFPSAQEWST